MRIQDEVRQILKKRTAFETALVRRIAHKSDYLQYLAYEIQLETLRKKRIQRLSMYPAPPGLCSTKRLTSNHIGLSGGKRTVSDYALVRRQLHIMDRAVQRFKADVALWVQYIRLAQKEGARTLAGKICARQVLVAHFIACARFMTAALTLFSLPIDLSHARLNRRLSTRRTAYL